MKHFGIWITPVNAWMINGNGDIFWTTSRAVAQATLERATSWAGETRKFEIREFIETSPHQEERVFTDEEISSIIDAIDKRGRRPWRANREQIPAEEELRLIDRGLDRLHQRTYPQTP